MAKVKGKRTTRRKTTRRRKITSKKTNRHNFYLLLFVIAILLFFIIYYFNFFQQPQNNIPPTTQNQATTTGQTPTQTNVVGGSCSKNSECFITFCKDQKEDCINTTQLSSYGKSCKTYSDWVIEKQDTSRCSCVQNACTMIK